MALIDAAANLEIDKGLAARYVVAPRGAALSASARCLLNGNLAAEHGRAELWRLWMLASTAFSAAEQERHLLLATSFSLMAPLLQVRRP